jgi:predicted phosphodiesterase
MCRAPAAQDLHVLLFSDAPIALDKGLLFIFPHLCVVPAAESSRTPWRPPVLLTVWVDENWHLEVGLLILNKAHTSKRSSPSHLASFLPGPTEQFLTAHSWPANTNTMEPLLSKVQQHLNPRPRIQILSDLHLEVGQQYSTFTFPTSAPLLLLAGDIGRLIDYNEYRTFLESQVARYKKVLLILGNHEFYGLDHPSGVATALRLAAEPSLASGLVLLHRARWDDPDSDLTILGCTLWSAIPPEAYGVVEAKVNDFKKINDWSARQHNAVHDEEVAWLREEVRRVQAGAAKRRLLIATHHAPCVEGTSRPEQVNNPWTSAFATDLVDQAGWEGVKVWVFGHTHYSARFSQNAIKVVSNQRGYVLPGSTAQREEGAKRENGHGFDPALVINV